MALYAIQGAYSLAVQASIPLLVKEEKLVPANTAVNLVNSLSNMLGPVIGGVLYGTFGLTIVLIRTLPIKDKTENNTLLCSYPKIFPL